MVRLQPQLVLEEDDGAEFGGVVFDVEPVYLAFNNGMAPTDRDVVYPNLTLVTTSKLELGLLWRHRKQMDVSRSVLVEGHRLQEDVVGGGLRCNLINKVDNFIDGHANLESVGIHLLADLTLKTLPVEGSDVHVGGAGGLLLLLGEHPTLKTLEMDESDGTLALAGYNEWVMNVILVPPAYTTLHLVWASTLDVLHTCNFHGLPQLLVVELLL